MRAASDDKSIEQDPLIRSNGVDARTGLYLLGPLTSAAIAAVARGETLPTDLPEKAHLAELRSRQARKNERHFGVGAGVDPTKLEQTGWAVIFPAAAKGSPKERTQDEIREALAPLLALRRAQACRIHEDYYKEILGPQGYRFGESKQAFLARLGVGPGTPDPKLLPYYLLLVASPDVLPYHVQYQIDVQYAVARIHFDTLDEFAHHGRSVVAAETSGLVLPREIAFVGVSNPGDDATQLSRKYLVEPLADMAEGWTDIPPRRVIRYLDDGARKATVSQLFGGPRSRR